MIVKIHKTDDNRMVLAICDSSLIGKKFEEGKKQLDLTSDFYKGQEMSEKEVGNLLRNSYLTDVVGEKSIALAIKEGIINESNIKKISNVPYTQIIVNLC